MVEITKEFIMKIIKAYMLGNNIGYFHLNAMTDITKSEVKMSFREEEDPDPLDELLNNPGLLN